MPWIFTEFHLRNGYSSVRARLFNIVQHEFSMDARDTNLISIDYDVRAHVLMKKKKNLNSVFFPLLRLAYDFLNSFRREFSSHFTKKSVDFIIMCMPCLRHSFSSQTTFNLFHLQFNHDAILCNYTECYSIKRFLFSSAHVRNTHTHTQKERNERKIQKLREQNCCRVKSFCFASRILRRLVNRIFVKGMRACVCECCVGCVLCEIA